MWVEPSWNLISFEGGACPQLVQFLSGLSAAWRSCQYSWQGVQPISHRSRLASQPHSVPQHLYWKRSVLRKGMRLACETTTEAYVVREDSWAKLASQLHMWTLLIRILTRSKVTRFSTCELGLRWCAWAIIWLPKPQIKPCIVRHHTRDKTVPALSCPLYSMQQKAGEEPGNEDKNLCHIYLTQVLIQSYQQLDSCESVNTCFEMQRSQLSRILHECHAFHLQLTLSRIWQLASHTIRQPSYCCL